MRKKKKKLIIVITILALASLILMIYLFNQEKNFIYINYYDINGNLIQNFYSIIIPATAYYFDLTVNVKNTGNLILNCVPITFSPNELNQAMPKNYQIVNPGKSIEWTSNRMLISDFLGRLNPQRFSATISCYNQDYINKTYMNQTGFVDLDIKTICGNNICEFSESSSCPNDCTHVIFRTSDLVYGINSAIAYTNTCGNTLTKYGIEWSTCWTVTSQTCPTRVGYTLILNQSYNIKGRPIWAGSNVGCFYSDNNNATKVAMAWKVASSSGSMCSIQGQWGIKIYSQSSPKAVNVNNANYILNLNNEITCIG